MTAEEQHERQALISAALTWVGTPFQWEACIKGPRGGVDCGRVIAAALNEAGLRKIDLAALPHLPPQWFRHHASGSYLELIQLYAVEYCPEPGQKPEPGDIVVAKYGLDWAHSALVIKWPKVLAAVPGSRVLLWPSLHLSPHYANPPLKYFDPWRKR